MFRRRDRRREDSSGTRIADPHAHEVAKLKARLAELEQALGQVLEASDDLLVDLRIVQHDRQRLSNETRQGFAEVWLHSEPMGAELEEFFTVGHVDKRARRWLLAAN